MALCLGGCAAGIGEPAPAVDPDAERQATRAIWGIVPEPPRRKTDLHPAMLAGSAVAVSERTLLADCAATSGNDRVGLVRHNKYRMADVTPGPDGRLCLLTVADASLVPATGYRSFADVRLGEPVSALSNRSATQVLVVRGWLAGKGDPADPFLETTATLPATPSAVLIDGRGNVLGLGAVAPLQDATLVAAPVQPAFVTALANRDLGLLGPVLAGAVSDPRARPAQAPIVLALGDDRDSPERPRPIPVAAETPARDVADDTPASGTDTPTSGSDPTPSEATDSSSAPTAPDPPAAPDSTTAPDSPAAPAPQPGAGPDPGPTPSSTDDGRARGRGRGRDGLDGRGRGRGDDDRRGHGGRGHERRAGG
ncbi:MAG: hypothetical protein U1E52_13050 [Geminicoccaceae bacterium]